MNMLGNCSIASFKQASVEMFQGYSAYFERRVAFQKFLMEFSVRPGRRLVILDQWLPTTAWHWANRNSSSKDQLPLHGSSTRGQG